MKAVPLFLAGSLVANAVLAALLLQRSSVSANSSAGARPAAPVVVPVTVTKAEPPPVSVASPPPLARDDFAGLAARLKAAGVPSSTIQIAVTMAIKQHFDRRRTELGLRPDPAGFVRNPITNALSESAEIQASRAAMDREERELVHTIVGEDLKMSFDAMRRISGNLPEDKAHRLLKIVNDYRQMEAQLTFENPDGRAPENRAKITLLEKEKRTDIERLLTPEELLDYDLRTSSTGGIIRNRVGMFTVTEAEFRALHAAFKVAGDAADAAGVPQRRRERDAVFEPELRRVLGEERYAEMQTADRLETERIRSFSEARTFTQGLKLPSTAANDLLILQAEFRPRLAALEAARAASAQERDAQISALAREAQTKLTRLLGEDGFNAYRTRSGQWIDQAIGRANAASDQR